MLNVSLCLHKISGFQSLRILQSWHIHRRANKLHFELNWYFATPNNDHLFHWINDMKSIYMQYYHCAWELIVSSCLTNICRDACIHCNLYRFDRNLIWFYYDHSCIQWPLCTRFYNLILGSWLLHRSCLIMWLDTKAVFKSCYNNKIISLDHGKQTLTSYSHSSTVTGDTLYPLEVILLAWATSLLVIYAKSWLISILSFHNRSANTLALIHIFCWWVYLLLNSLHIQASAPITLTPSILGFKAYISLHLMYYP